MRDDAGDEKLLARYLLGGSSDKERLLIEELFLRDDQCYERLLALENELFYDYAQGKLSSGEREQFEKRFLTSERGRKRAILAAALTRKLFDAPPVRTTESVPADRKPQLWRQSLKSYFSQWGAPMRLSLAALAVALCGSTWLVFEIAKLRNEFDQFRTQRMAQEEQLQQQAQQERARSDDLNLTLKRAQGESAALKQELNIKQARSESDGRRRPAVISFVLAPSFVRGAANNFKRLYLPPMTRMLRLQLNLKGEVEYQSYQAIVSTAEGAERWSQDQLRAEPRGSGRSLVLRLPAGILDAGDYELKLKGLAADGTLEDTGDYYYFSIRR